MAAVHLNRMVLMNICATALHHPSIWFKCIQVQVFKKEICNGLKISPLKLVDI